MNNNMCNTLDGIDLLIGYSGRLIPFDSPTYYTACKFNTFYIILMQQYSDYNTTPC